MSGFFGFDAALPERRQGQQQQQYGGQQCRRISKHPAVGQAAGGFGGFRAPMLPTHSASQLLERRRTSRYTPGEMGWLASLFEEEMTI